MKKYQNRPIPSKIDPLSSAPRVEPVKDPPAMPGLGIPASPLGQPAVEIRVVKPTCGLCEYFSRISDRPSGFCRRFPPFRQNNSSQSMYPNVSDTDWCGEFDAGEQRA
jgi:hypothetical protein